MRVEGWVTRRAVKQGLAPLGWFRSARGCTILTYHRIGGGTPDERDVSLSDFERQVEILRSVPVLSLDDALDRLASGDTRPSVVLTFDDGFADVYERAWPLLRANQLPFTVYVSTAYVGDELRWEGSTAKVPGGRALSWGQLAELARSGLCTIGNHTHGHVRPEGLTKGQVEACDRAVLEHLGIAPRHFAYPWGIRVPTFEPELRRRYRSAVTGLVGRNGPTSDFMRLRRLAVRRTDPPAFFGRKVRGGLVPERAYQGLVTAAKRVGVRG
ncbi:MAG: polysaccharide deacetylase family protein [Nitriliruptorales bacterium]|nr:polysaccharide deacetylase family protein [Nitriliruptorales bacterium]